MVVRIPNLDVEVAADLENGSNTLTGIRIAALFDCNTAASTRTANTVHMNPTSVDNYSKNMISTCMRRQKKILYVLRVSQFENDTKTLRSREYISLNVGCRSVRCIDDLHEQPENIN